MPSLSIFRKIEHSIGSVRAPEIMNTQSTTEFQWSVKLIGTRLFNVGIATTLKRSKQHICTYDLEAIYYSSAGYLWNVQKQKPIGDFDTQKSGDIISFKFQPQSKKLHVKLSSSVGNSNENSWFASVAVKDNINYFPFAQLVGLYAHEAILT